MSVSLASVVTRICARVGLTDIDVTDLEDRYIEGYVISRVMSAANALEPLRQVGYFDIVESGTTLKFIARGKAAVRTLTDQEIGAFDVSGNNGSIPPAITTRKVQDVELPRQLRLHFRNPERDYEDDEQLSPSRVSTAAVNDVDVELAVSITAQQASQVAEVLWADPWAGRWAHQTNVDHSHSDLEPADIIHVPVDGRLQRVRIVSIDDAAGIMRKLEMVRDDDGTYSPAVVPVDGAARTPTVLAAISNTDLIFLDLPSLRSEDTDAGFYLAVRSNNDATIWRGVTIYRSFNNGASFETLLSCATQALTGTLVNALPVGALPAGSPLTWDDVNTLTIEVESGTPESRTENDVLYGANNIAIGADERWEIVGFTTAVQISETQWELTHLLRGRRCTEYTMGLSQAGDRAVLVSGNGIVRVPLDPALIGEPILYRAVSVGAAFNDGVDVTYVGAGRDLLPCSQSNLAAVRQANGNIDISWTRRDRLGQELVYFGTDPESDAPASYSIDVFNPGSPSAVVRTLTSSTNSVTYTNAQQQTDWGSPTPATITFKVYKVSATMGRGIEAVATGSLF